MHTIRTDLAAEAHALWREKAEKTTKLAGVAARREQVEGLCVERVEILDEEGERALGKGRGTYLTVDLAGLRPGDGDSFRRGVEAVAALVSPMLPTEGAVLVAGLGNREMTVDALGPRTADQVLVTRHLDLPGLRPVCALAGGVLGSTGMEAAEWIRGAVQRVKPAAVILVDALAARSLDRLCTSLQVSNTGMVPGSGVGNHRLALTEGTLGAAVISVGVPTVVEAATLAADLLGSEVPAQLRERGRLFVTGDRIDEKIRYLSRLLGQGLSAALQPELTPEDIAALLE